jgi:hypothetical protein
MGPSFKGICGPDTCHADTGFFSGLKNLSLEFAGVFVYIYIAKHNDSNRCLGEKKEMKPNNEVLYIPS